MKPPNIGPKTVDLSALEKMKESMDSVVNGAVKGEKKVEQLSQKTLSAAKELIESPQKFLETKKEEFQSTVNKSYVSANKATAAHAKGMLDTNAGVMRSQLDETVSKIRKNVANDGQISPHEKGTLQKKIEHGARILEGTILGAKTGAKAGFENGTEGSADRRSDNDEDQTTVRKAVWQDAIAGGIPGAIIGAVIGAREGSSIADKGGNDAEILNQVNKDASYAGGMIGHDPESGILPSGKDRDYAEYKKYEASVNTTDKLPMNYQDWKEHQRYNEYMEEHPGSTKSYDEWQAEFGGYRGANQESGSGSVGTSTNPPAANPSDVPDEAPADEPATPKDGSNIYDGVDNALEVTPNVYDDVPRYPKS
jgi:hypothetical protein